ncbi:MAG: hypothetical protein DRI24_16355 [Deltaproteobacteria bacterium]|nr:MAG: hypothetical protein DRI24_16355 [Deltaproteobacteria bacterium]
MTSKASDPLSSLLSLEQLLVSHGYDDSREAMAIIANLRSALHENGYKEVILPPPPSNYTVERAEALQKLSVDLRDTMLRSSAEGSSYTDRAVALSIVSNSYLQLAHAFKVDSKVWSFAQDDLVPVLSVAVDEASLDVAVLKLISHLDRYITSLDKWLSA